MVGKPERWEVFTSILQPGCCLVCVRVVCQIGETAHLWKSRDSDLRPISRNEALPIVP